MRSILNAQPGPRDLKQFASSIKGAEIAVALQPSGSVWPFSLVCQQTGESVSASTGSGPASQCRLAS